jgi:hypothetical protein
MRPRLSLALLTLPCLSIAAPTDDISDILRLRTPPMNATHPSLTLATTDYGHCNPGQLYCWSQIMNDLRAFSLVAHRMLI